MGPYPVPDAPPLSQGKTGRQDQPRLEGMGPKPMAISVLCVYIAPVLGLYSPIYMRHPVFVSDAVISLILREHTIYTKDSTQASCACNVH